MVDNVIIFKGSKSDFNDFLIRKLGKNGESIPFMELIQHYNARLRPNESGVREDALANKLYFENCIVKADDYASVLPHTLSNFSTIITINSNIGNLIVHNPPRRVEHSLKNYMKDDIRYEYSEYQNICKGRLNDIYVKLNSDILGQFECKKRMVAGIYKLIKGDTKKPVVLMFYGPSGVGKTESAKCISNSLGGNLLRIQFSMMQTMEAFNYVFGSDHSNNSLAKDMLSRESNVILIDEFDKVDPRFYNAFYELFDEGRFVDTNYEVDLKQAIFILTCNYNNEEEIRKSLGPAMYSRISECIQFEELEETQKRMIIESWYKEICYKLDEEENAVVNDTDVLTWFLDNTLRYNNIRILKSKLESAIFQKLAEFFIFDAKT